MGGKFHEAVNEGLWICQGKIIQTSAGELRPDYFHPDTGVAVDIKVGQQSVTDFAETQMTKYALANMEGQISNSLHILLRNPWSGSYAGRAFTQALEDYEIGYIQERFW